MFTQCPDCQTTFRVSEEVLQKADGRVRCGGCGNAFHALKHLSQKDADQAEESDSDQNKQLLETLDKIAGPEVRLEDTGTEWRVLEDLDGEDSEDESSENAAIHGRQSDLPHPPPDQQSSLDLPARTGQRRYDDNTVLPDDFGDEDDLDELPFLEARIPKRRTGDRESANDDSESADSQVVLALGEPDEWEGLLDEVDVEKTGSDATAQASAEDDSDAQDDTDPDAVGEDAADDEPPGEDMPSDINSQFLLQAEEMGLDTGGHPIVVEGESAADDVLAVDEEDDEEEDIVEADMVETDVAGPDTDIEETDVADRNAEEDEDDDSEINLEEIEALADLDIESVLAASDNEDAAAPEEADVASATASGGENKIDKPFDEDSSTVENIVMEGELVGDSISQKRMIDTKGIGELQDIGQLQDTYSLNRGVSSSDRVSKLAGHAITGSVFVLALLLIGQILHQSRQSLATYGLFNDTLAPIYRALGKPVTPEWDIRGWRFEATSGKVDEDEDLLTIYSRIANKSSQALPYPLVHISLTDRWEDVIGSRALEPSEYLSGNLDPRKPVVSGENFTAVITIESPSVDATGFRLMACYRISPGRARCAYEHFKD